MGGSPRDTSLIIIGRPAHAQIASSQMITTNHAHAAQVPALRLHSCHSRCSACWKQSTSCWQAMDKSREQGRTIPEETMPLSFAGLRFASTSTLRPCICSSGTNFTRPDTICSSTARITEHPPSPEQSNAERSDPLPEQQGSSVIPLNTTTPMGSLSICKGGV